MSRHDNDNTKIYTLAVLSDLNDVDFQLVVAVVSRSTRQQRAREESPSIGSSLGGMLNTR